MLRQYIADLLTKKITFTFENMIHVIFNNFGTSKNND